MAAGVLQVLATPLAYALGLGLAVVVEHYDLADLAAGFPLESVRTAFTRTSANGVAGDLCWFSMMLTLGVDLILDASVQHVRRRVALMDERLDEHGHQLLAHTVRVRRVAALSLLLRWAAQEELISANAVEHVMVSWGMTGSLQPV